MHDIVQRGLSLCERMQTSQDDEDTKPRRHSLALRQLRAIWAKRKGSTGFSARPVVKDLPPSDRRGDPATERRLKTYLLREIGPRSYFPHAKQSLGLLRELDKGSLSTIARMADVYGAGHHQSMFMRSLFNGYFAKKMKKPDLIAALKEVDRLSDDHLEKMFTLDTPKSKLKNSPLRKLMLVFGESLSNRGFNLLEVLDGKQINK